MRTKRENERWESVSSEPLSIKQQSYVDIDFDQLVIRNARVSDCTFRGVKFMNSCLGMNTTFESCTWTRCRLAGKGNTLGTHALFRECSFVDVHIQGIDSLSGVTMERCTLSGRLENMIIYGALQNLAPPTVLRDCDLSDAVFENVNIRLGVDLSSVRLPKQGIRLFRNTCGEFTSALRNGARGLTGQDGIALDVLGRQDQQDPMVLDQALLSSLLDSEKSRSEFETIATRFEQSARCGCE